MSDGLQPPLVISGATASDIDHAGLRRHNGRVTPAATVVWATGARGAKPPDALGLEQGSRDQIEITRELLVPERAEMLAIGNPAATPQGGDKPLTTLAQGARQRGCHAAEVISADAHDRNPEPFRSRDLGPTATQARDVAGAQIALVKLSARPDWLARLAVQIARLRPQLLVLANWAAGCLFTDWPVRLLAGPDLRPDDHETEA